MGFPPQSLLHWLVLLTLAAPAVLEVSPGEEDYTWSRMKVPQVVDRHTIQLQSPAISTEGYKDQDPVCGIECQRNLPEPGTVELERFLSYETFYENGTRTLTEVSLAEVNASSTRTMHTGLTRRRRHVYGSDGRFLITDKHFVTNYPFSASVKISTGCSGILVSSKHVLTAAHCVHDGRDYVKGSGRLRVGAIMLRSKRGGRKGGRKGRKRKAGSEHEGEERERRNGRKRKNRVRRSADEGRADSKGPKLRWTRVKQVYVPKGWMSEVGNEVTLDYDYALLELKRALRTKPMDLGLVPVVTHVPAARIHFSGFDEDHPDTVMYRFCSVSEESSDLMYQRCDAQRGSSGAGIYVRLKEPAGTTPSKRKWRRKVIAVFSGHRWVNVNGTQKDYNVAVRITPAKYAQICHWMHGSSRQCKLA